MIEFEFGCSSARASHGVVLCLRAVSDNGSCGNLMVCSCAIRRCPPKRSEL